MKKSILLITTLMILFVSCQKNIDTLVPEPFNIEQAKSFFKQKIEKRNEGRQMSTQKGGKNIRQVLGKTALWNEAFIKKISIGDAIVIPCITIACYIQKLVIPSAHLPWITLVI